jgi:hypothetical protein
LTEISVEAIESVNQLADTWRAFVTDHGSGDVRDLPGMAIRWADSKFSFWNCITLTDQGADRTLGNQKECGEMKKNTDILSPSTAWSEPEGSYYRSKQDECCKRDNARRYQE